MGPKEVGEKKKKRGRTNKKVTCSELQIVIIQLI
jgi:hypothetical protein